MELKAEDWFDSTEPTEMAREALRSCADAFDMLLEKERYSGLLFHWKAKDWFWEGLLQKDPYLGAYFVAAFKARTALAALDERRRKRRQKE
jgi:hypothetical protein